MNRIAPNNQLPATHFIGVSVDNDGVWYRFPLPIGRLSSEIKYTESQSGCNVIAIFRIRENKLPTKHKF